MSADARDPIVTGERRTPVSAELELEVPDPLAWCNGHFPGFAVVPGVVLVGWALAQGRRLFAIGAGGQTALQVKFRRLVRPGDRLTLELRHVAASGRLSFAYRDGDELRSTGHVTFRS